MTDEPETDTDTDTGDDATTDSPSAPGTPAAAATAKATERQGPVLVLAVSLAVVFAIVAAVLGVVAAGRGGGDGRVEALRKAAGQAGQALLTYDYHHPDAHKEKVLSLATGSFRTEYESAFDQGLGALITKVQATSEGFVKDVYVSELDSEQGEAIVRADVTRDGAGGKRTIYDIYVLLSMVEVKGTWKVDQVTDLNFATETSDPSDPGATSTTTPVP